MEVPADNDRDGECDLVDGDDDNDGVIDLDDAFPNNPLEREDSDADGIGDNSDNDDDGDGRLDATDVASANAGGPRLCLLSPNITVRSSLRSVHYPPRRSICLD